MKTGLKKCCDCPYEEVIVEGRMPVGFATGMKNGKMSVLKRCRPCNAKRKAKYKKGGDFYEMDNQAYQLAGFAHQFMRRLI